MWWKCLLPIQMIVFWLFVLVVTNCLQTIRGWTKTDMRRALLAGMGLGVTCVGYKLSQDRGVQRSVEFWKEIGPIYLDYRLVQLRNETFGSLADEDAKKEYVRLHQQHADHIRYMTYKLGGFYLKSAQFMSVLDDFVPPEYMSWMKDTQDNVPSGFESASEVRKHVAKVLKEELNKDFDDVFSSFDDAPLGVASIGQVHKAVLRETGETVAVKIQIPDIETCFRSDIATITNFCELALPQFVPTFAEMEKQFCTEFDYRGEAKNLNTVRELVLPEWEHVAYIPKPHLDYCSQHILTMEYVEGVRLIDGIKDQYRRVAEATGQSYEKIEAERVAAVKAGTFKFKSLSESQQELHSTKSKLFWKDMMTTLNIFRVVNNWTPLRLIFGEQELYETPTPLDLAHIMQLLSDIHAYEMFHCGAFNGDPHPGNILLLTDGRLGLIDYGQVKTLEDKHRILYAKLMLALNKDDKDEIVNLYKNEMGIRTKNNLSDVLYRHAVFYHDRDTPDIMGDLNAHLFLEKLEKDDPVKYISEEYIMAGRMNFLMRGVAKAFGLELRMSEMWKPQAEAYLRSKGQL